MDGKNRGATLNGGWYLIMDKKSKNKAAAWELIMALSNKKNQLRGALQWANGPIRSSVYTNAEYLKKFPVAKAWLTALSRGSGAAQHPRASEISDATSQEVINFLQKKKSAKQAMQGACKPDQCGSEVKRPWPEDGRGGASPREEVDLSSRGRAWFFIREDRPQAEGRRGS